MASSKSSDPSLDFDASVSERGADILLVVYDEPEPPGPDPVTGTPGGDRDELVADVDERDPRTGPAAQLELEESPVPGECVVDVPDLEGDVVDAYEARHRWALGAGFHLLRFALCARLADW